MNTNECTGCSNFDRCDRINHIDNAENGHCKPFITKEQLSEVEAIQNEIHN